MIQREGYPNEQDIIALTSFMMKKHYCENDVDAVVEQMDDDIIWLGAAEHEYAAGAEQVAAIFRQFVGKVPKCNVWDEEYEVIEMAPGVYLCSGRMWIATDVSTGISLRVHQRFTVAFRLKGEQLRCCHIHISNPYEEMTENDVGFPEGIARQSYLYLQEQIDLQKKKIAEQTALLKRMSYEDSLTGVYNRNKFNVVLEGTWDQQQGQLGVACFDLNGLKQVNDRLGHGAGDDLIRRTANQIRRFFKGKIYRVGGDEFVVIDETRAETDFRAAVEAVRAGMEREHISCAIGISWRAAPCSVEAQADEADKRMYIEKRHYYNDLGMKKYEDEGFETA